MKGEKILIIKEEGFFAAMLGLSLSYGKIKSFNSDSDLLRTEMWKVANRLAHKGGGHNKFLESMVLWMVVTAPRYVWQEFDTYRVGITKQSGSTMHTIKKDIIYVESMDLEANEGDYQIMLDAFERIRSRGNLHDIKVALPEGFLQQREICVNYMTLQNIYRQRHNHKLNWWKEFCLELLEKVEHPEFINNK